MPVVFDQVVGNVIPETAPTQAEPETAPLPEVTGEEKLRRLLRRREQRLARLKAD
jgi:hypothetical protein